MIYLDEDGDEFYFPTKGDRLCTSGGVFVVTGYVHMGEYLRVNFTVEPGNSVVSRHSMEDFVELLELANHSPVSEVLEDFREANSSHFPDKVYVCGCPFVSEDLIVTFDDVEEEDN